MSHNRAMIDFWDSSKVTKDYLELKGALFEVFQAGKITPLVHSTMVKHGVVRPKSLDPSKAEEVLKYLAEPMRDDDLGQRARVDLDQLARACLTLQGLVVEMIRWRTGLIDYSTLVATVESFLRGDGDA